MLHDDSSTSTNSNNQGTNNGDWREQRREWRRARREERWKDPFRGLFIGLMLILVGVLFMLNQTGVLTGDNWWGYLPLGIGILMIINGLVHYGNPEYRYRGCGRFIGGTILILVGGITVLGLSQWWPLTLIAVGIALLLCVFLRRELLTGR